MTLKSLSSMVEVDGVDGAVIGGRIEKKRKEEKGEEERGKNGVPKEWEN
jgi:hypothetical protein